MRPARLALTRGLIDALGIMALPGAGVVEARRANEAELLSFHTPEYLRVLRQANNGVVPAEGASYGLGYGDNPAFKGVYDWSCLSAGASIQAAELVAGGDADIAFNIAGGLHHAMPGRASGFCYINDPVVAIKALVGMGRRVAYVDIDAHHGDGVEYAFYDSKDVLTISIHESGLYLFPGTGFPADMGIRDGRGYSVNLPLPPGSGDEVFVHGFEEVVPLFIEAFAPDVLVTQLGVDTFASDPITHLSLTTNGFERMVKRFRALGLPWVALGGGGYDMSNVARAWALAWALMNGVEPLERIPQSFLADKGEYFTGDRLRDEPLKTPALSADDSNAVDRDIAFLKKEVLPLVRRG
ncbi:MAG: acetoin utilization protein AcuC [Deltaproteobacteria bacterium]|nr:acetoin utilization protein AcuC [Deltaproteobacteria bacterium]